MKTYKLNPETGKWEPYDDHSARVKASREAFKRVEKAASGNLSLGRGDRFKDKYGNDCDAKGRKYNLPPDFQHIEDSINSRYHNDKLNCRTSSVSDQEAGRYNAMLSMSGGGWIHGSFSNSENEEHSASSAQDQSSEIAAQRQVIRLFVMGFVILALFAVGLLLFG